MASPTGTSSSSLQSSEENLQCNMIEIRKRKRMLSNRESARRSRMKKQKHLDDLMAQVANLRAENNHTLININLVTQLCLNVESENSVLRAQIFELNHRLQALTDIINCMSLDESGGPGFDSDDYGCYDDDLSPLDLIHVDQPIMASSSDVLMY